MGRQGKIPTEDRKQKTSDPAKSEHNMIDQNDVGFVHGRCDHVAVEVICFSYSFSLLCDLAHLVFAPRVF
jgi:hypothetical protein